MSRYDSLPAYTKGALCQSSLSCSHVQLSVMCFLNLPIYLLPFNLHEPRAIALRFLIFDAMRGRRHIGEVPVHVAICDSRWARALLDRSAAAHPAPDRAPKSLECGNSQGMLPIA